MDGLYAGDLAHKYTVDLNLLYYDHCLLLQKEIELSAGHRPSYKTKYSGKLKCFHESKPWVNST